MPNANVTASFESLRTGAPPLGRGRARGKPRPGAAAAPRPLRSRWAQLRDLAIGLLRLAFLALIVRPAVFLLLGLEVRGRALLPEAGPAIVVANHNSHLDTLALLSMFPLRLLHKVRPVAAADYFAAPSSILGWIARNLIGIIPIRRGCSALDCLADDPLQPAVDALAAGAILVIYPEGTRGEPDKIARFKTGVGHLVERFPEVPVTPVFLHGLGKAWPKGGLLPLPLLSGAFVAAPMRWCGDRYRFVDALEARVRSLARLVGGAGGSAETSAAEDKRALEAVG